MLSDYRANHNFPVGIGMARQGASCTMKKLEEKLPYEARRANRKCAGSQAGTTARKCGAMVLVQTHAPQAGVIVVAIKTSCRWPANVSMAVSECEKGKQAQTGWLELNRQARFQIGLVVAQLGEGPDAGREKIAPAHK